ncbi:28S ribosomal protein S18b, mitochondrial-like [Branchiostoma floridae]|uniref:Small ribosomal subunit protein mS40 n=1 Tax=Branchiostoma floridae TaxID=7739 RepID=A0A9J7LIA3_BRAFL|nr:28S ribosomal protein S18b, mitochondrial-like [Branchiostoma floridae]
MAAPMRFVAIQLSRRVYPLWQAVSHQRNLTTQLQARWNTSSYLQQARSLSRTSVVMCDAEEENVEEGASKESELPVVTWEESVRYLQSSEFAERYNGREVWWDYVRNHKGSVPPQKTRKTCIRARRIATGNPCPICRDQNLVVDYRNVELLQHFICPHTGEMHNVLRTGVCQKKHRLLIKEIEKAKDHGKGFFNTHISRIYLCLAHV